MKFITGLLVFLCLSHNLSAQSIAIVQEDSLSFSAKENNGMVNLYWTTFSELKLNHFEVQRSADARDFVLIGKEPVSADTKGLSYSMNDKQPVAGKNYYRLVFVNEDGSQKYSNVILIDIKQAGKTDFVITPNPSHSKSTISISGSLKGKISIIMYDLNGSKVDELYSGELNSNAFSTTFSVANLKKGIYIISVHIGNEYTRQKLVVE